jgi:guanylate kinase
LTDNGLTQTLPTNDTPLLIVVSGASGSGKDSVVRALLERSQATCRPFHFVVTATSRPKREEEVDGVDYVFVTEQEFQTMIANNELIEYAVVYGQYKGVPTSHLDEALKAMDRGRDVLMRLDVQGAKTIRKMHPQALLIFISAPSPQELLERLHRRRTETPEQLEIRQRTARREIEQISDFDYVVPNADGKLAQTVDTILSIIVAEKHKTHPRRVRS